MDNSNQTVVRSSPDGLGLVGELSNAQPRFRVEPLANCAAAVACRNWDGKNFPPLDDNVRVVSYVHFGQPAMDIIYADQSTLNIVINPDSGVRVFWWDKS